MQNVQDVIKNGFNKLYIPGESLLLDETLIPDLGCIKFKVMIVTKESSYYIKIYVVTDVETAFFLKMIIYTGKYTYAGNKNAYILNYVKVIFNCVSHFKVYVEIFLNASTLTLFE